MLSIYQIEPIEKISLRLAKDAAFTATICHLEDKKNDNLFILTCVPLHESCLLADHAAPVPGDMQRQVFRLFLTPETKPAKQSEAWQDRGVFYKDLTQLYHIVNHCWRHERYIRAEKRKNISDASQDQDAVKNADIDRLETTHFVELNEADDANALFRVFGLWTNYTSRG
ncbi:MAG: hypothetical protein GY862_35940 [Gammaproteobacteria bacterium]|nr:hypothetical protein [Gammaproteobacteria bacterium]